MKLSETEQALRAVVDAERARRVDTIRAEADARARAILEEAYSRARREVRDAFLAARSRSDERIAVLNARLATAQRLHEQRRMAAILAAEWSLLPDALLARWRRSETRRHWVWNAVQSASSRLPHSHWRIEHPVDWPESERAELEAELRKALGFAPSFVADGAIKAGLRIHANHNTVDATFEGLLADREAIGARLLSLTRSPVA